ncbi:Ger(x)C family spore germination protein [Cohnella sp. LGH]|uniref:Ger(x)C family spore germination protein n=1 Tax=Cohnella sp. LGH TaxID=1619153 RepID=UPI001ADBD827|nr:Ger(x)C family spore germination protein [Cohnella sp. LGH]QTH39907.1 Ger(x)C family spore germination protein [Cohnella sp. LGH]
MRAAGRIAWVLAVCALVCSGCDGSLELNELYIVHSVALDAGKNGGVKLSAEIARLESGQQQPKGMQNKTFMLTGEGSNIFEAARLMRAKSDRTLLWGQTTAIVISKDIALQSFDKQIETLRRFRQFRNTTLVYMIDGQASRVLEVEMPNASISAQALRGLAEGGEITGLTSQISLLDIYKDRINGYQEICIPAVRVLKSKDGGADRLIKAAGFFAFRGEQLAGFMPARISKGYLRASNRMRSTIEKLACDGKPGNTIAFENTRSSSRVAASLDKTGTPSVRIEVDTDLNLVGQPCEDQTVTPELIAEWEKQLNSEIEDQINGFIAFSQQHATDLLGIGERIHRKQPQQWKRIKDEWREIYPTCRFTVEVNTRIDHTNFTI